MPEKMNILVTGGAGYIGGHTVLQLLLGGYKTVVVDNLDNSSDVALKRVRELAGEHASNLTFHKVGSLSYFFWFIFLRLRLVLLIVVQLYWVLNFHKVLGFVEICHSRMLAGSYDFQAFGLLLSGIKFLFLWGI